MSSKRRQYSEHERRTAMAAYAFTSGNEDYTVELLAENGLDIPFNTIKSWVRRYKDDYRQVRSNIDDHTRALDADLQRRIGNQYAELEEIGIRDLKREFAEGKITGKDLAKSLKDIAIAGAVHIDKAEKLNDRPTVVVEHDISEIKRALADGGIKFIEPVSAETIEVDVVKELPA